MSGWSRQHEQTRRRIRELMEGRVRSFEDASERAAAERREQDLLPWCRTYLPHYVDCDFAPFHRRMVEAVGERGMPTFVGAFRGAGKSVLLGLARPLKRALEGRAPYFLYGSQVRRLAAQNMDYVRLELQHNARIRADYGEVETDGSQHEWVAELRGGDETRSVKFEAFGIGMSPRGRRHGQHRPLEFVGDDLEDAELARSPRREQQLWDWLMDAVVPALEPRRFRFTVLGTMFGPECMLQKARRLSRRTDPDGRPLAKVFLQPVTERDDDGEERSVWPERFSGDDLDRVRGMIGLRNWMRNFALSPHDPQKPFQPEWLGDYDPAEVDESALDVVAFLDPALSTSSGSCPRALVVVGCDRDSGVRYVLDAWIDRATPGELVERLMRVHKHYRPRVMGVESNGGYALIKPLLERHDGGRGRHLPVTYVTHSRPKEVRIETLCTQFEKGLWKFPRNPGAGVKTLQEQFLNYPDGYDDGPDACAGCDELLPDGFRSAGDAPPRYRTISRRREVDWV